MDYKTNQNKAKFFTKDKFIQKQNKDNNENKSDLVNFSITIYFTKDYSKNTKLIEIRHDLKLFIDEYYLFLNNDLNIIQKQEESDFDLSNIIPIPEPEPEPLIIPNEIIDNNNNNIPEEIINNNNKETTQIGQQTLLQLEEDITEESKLTYN